jgi:hypothetical protein
LCPTPHRGMRHHRISVVPQGPVNADLIAETRAAIAEASDALGRAQRALDLLDLGPAPLSTPEPPPRLLTVSQAASRRFYQGTRCRGGVVVPYGFVWAVRFVVSEKYLFGAARQAGIVHKPLRGEVGGAPVSGSAVPVAATSGK